ncbi:hypothetical protein GFS31_35010 [Leptolyngbya sp. BL0902]|nr:hypothetical protein GFS31_35010 [Leptolyngbya sp. BL0902]
MTPTLKIALIRLFLRPNGLASIIILALLGLIVAYGLLPPAPITIYQERDTFPHPWQGVSPTRLMPRMIWLNRAIAK